MAFGDRGPAGPPGRQAEARARRGRRAARRVRGRRGRAGRCVLVGQFRARRYVADRQPAVTGGPGPNRRVRTRPQPASNGRGQRRQALLCPALATPPPPPPPGSATGSPRPFPAAATAAARAPGRPAPGAPRPAPGLRNGRRGRLDRSEHGEGPETPASPSRSPHRFLRPLGHRGASLSPATLAYSQRRAFRLPERAAGQATCCRPSAGPRAAGCRGPGVAGTSAFPLPSHSGRTPPPWGGREGRRGAGERPEAGKSSRGEGAGRPFRAPRGCVSRDYKARRVSPERDCPERGGGWRRESATHEHRPLYY